MSSHAAVDRLQSSGALSRQRAAVLALVQRYPGLSSKQLALTVEAQATGCDRPMIARRLPDLEERGFVKRGEKVRGAELRWFPCREERPNG